MRYNSMKKFDKHWGDTLVLEKVSFKERGTTKTYSKEIPQ